MENSSQEIAQHFDDRAVSYSGNAEWVKDRNSLAPVVEQISRHGGRRLLDLGCGTGVLAPYLEKADCAIDYFGIDVSLRMVAASEDSRHWLVGDAAHLPIQNGTFDCVVARQSFHYFKSPAAVLGEVRRVLLPNGILVLAQLVPYADQTDEEWWRATVEVRQPLRRHAWSSSKFVAELEACGFTDIGVSFVEGRSSLQQWLGRYPASRSVGRELADLFADAPERVKSLRRFALEEGDIHYSIRWMIATGSSSKR